MWQLQLTVENHRRHINGKPDGDASPKGMFFPATVNSDFRPSTGMQPIEDLILLWARNCESLTRCLFREQINTVGKVDDRSS